MNKVITLAMMLAFALLASAEQFETVDLEVVEGGSVGHTYFGHHEAQAMGLYPYSPEYVTAWEMVNPSQNINKIRPGIYKFPVKKVEEPVTQTETKEITEDAPDGGSGTDGNNGTRTDINAVATGGRINLREAGLEPYSLEGLLATSEEGQSPEQPAIARSAVMESADTSVIEDLQAENNALKSEVERWQTMVRNGEWIEVGVLKTQEANIQRLTDENTRLERELADKSKAGAIAPGNNGLYLNNSSDSFIWILAVAAIAAAGIILILIPCVIYLYRQASQLPQKESDRLMLEKEIDKLKSTFEQRLAHQTKFLQEELNRSEREVKKGKRNLEFLKDLAKRNFFFFEYPGIVRKTNKQPVDYIVLRIHDRHPNGAVKSVIVPRIEEPVEVRGSTLESALRSDIYTEGDDAFILPPKLELIPKEIKEDVEFMPTLHNLPDKVEAQVVANAS